MSGAGLEDIQRPDRAYDLSHRTDFGSFRSRKRRDRKLKEQIDEAAEQAVSAELAEQLRALAHRLGYADRGENAPRSRASYVGQGRVRHVIGSDLYRLVSQTQRGGEFVTFATLVFRGGAIPRDRLLSIAPRRWAKQLKTDLDRIRRRLGLTGPGWSIWFLDADYLKVEDIILFHWHGFATGDELKAIDALTLLRKYASPRARPGQLREPVRHRKQRTHKPLHNIGYLCLYMLKEEWPSQPAARNVEGNRDRSFPRPLPANLRPLERLFFDRWSIRDVAVIRGLRVIDGHLCPTREE